MVTKRQPVKIVAQLAGVRTGQVGRSIEQRFRRLGGFKTGVAHWFQIPEDNTRISLHIYTQPAHCSLLFAPNPGNVDHLLGVEAVVDVIPL